MNNELREKAKAFGEKHRQQGTDGWQLMADFAGSLLPKWTYCEDALPEDENDYVATVFDQYHQSFFVHWSMFRDGVWDIEGEDLNWKVIAWQPLPAPAEPKEAK